MKLNNVYLCCESTCEEVFSICKENKDRRCPICGGRSIRNIGRLLNRKEEEDELHHSLDGLHVVGIPGNIFPGRVVPVLDVKRYNRV